MTHKKYFDRSLRLLTTNKRHFSIIKNMSQGLSNEKCILQSSNSNMEVSQVLPHLYLGCQDNVLSTETMQNNQITHVINVSRTGEKPVFLSEDDEHFLRIPVDDCQYAKLLPHFDQAFEFIEKARCNSGRVFIHCLAGISRSPTLAIAYVMRYLHLSAEEAYQYVKNCRPQISPNFNFLGQLYQYERNLISTPKSPLDILRPRVKCSIPEMCLNDRRYFVPFECSNNRNNSTEQSTDVSSSSMCFQYDLINTSKRKTLLSSPQTMSNLPMKPSQELTLISPKPSRPTSISIEFSTLVAKHSLSESNNSNCDRLTNNEEIENRSTNDNKLPSNEDIDLVNTYFQEPILLLNPLSKWETL